MCKGVMRAVGLEPKMPISAPVAMAPPPPAPAPIGGTTATTVAERMNEVGTEASAEERLRAGRARGRASTLLTGGQGVTDAPVLARPMAGAGTRALLG